MSDDKKEEKSNVLSMDDAKVKKLAFKGNYFNLLDQFDTLRVKFIYDQLDKQEALKFITLCKYFMKHGHSESIRLTCHYMYERYMKNHGL